MNKKIKMILAAFALLAFITIYRPFIEYFFPEMSANYAILLRKGLQALTVIVYITVMKLWEKPGKATSNQTSLSNRREHSLCMEQLSMEGILLLLPVVILSFSPYLFGFRKLDSEELTITFLICLLIGVIEEFSYRGIMYNAIQPYGDTAAVIVSSAVFGLIHLPNMFYNKDIEGTLYQMVFAFGFGLIMAVVRYKTGLLLPQLLVHALWDFNIKISETSLTILLADTINYISEILIVLLGLWLMILVIKQERHKKVDVIV